MWARRVSLVSPPGLCDSLALAVACLAPVICKASLAGALCSLPRKRLFIKLPVLGRLLEACYLEEGFEERYAMLFLAARVQPDFHIRKLSIDPSVLRAKFADEYSAQLLSKQVVALGTLWQDHQNEPGQLANLALINKKNNIKRTNKTSNSR